MPSNIKKTRWDAYKEVYDKVDSDPDEAFKVADELLSDNLVTGQPDQRSNRKYKNVGVKHHPGFGKGKLAPFPGCKDKSSDKIREIVARRYSGYGDAEIERRMGISEKYIWQLEVRHPEAFELAKQELIKNAVSEYETNITFARAALSEIGMRAVKTLSTVMDDTDAKPQTRLRAAETVLKLLMGASPGEKAIAEGVISKMGDFVQKVAQASRQSPSYIHSIDDAEIVEEEDGGKAPALAS